MKKLDILKVSNFFRPYYVQVIYLGF